MDYLYFSFAAAAFAAVVLLLAGAYSIWGSSHGAKAKRIAQRLQSLGQSSDEPLPDFSLLKQRVLSTSPRLQRLLMPLQAAHALDSLLQQAGLRYTVAQLLFASLGSACLALLLLLVTGVPAALTVLGAMAALGIPLLIVSGKKRKRLVRIEEQLPDALDLMSRALRAGHALPAAIKMAGDEMADPLAAEFRIVFDEVNYGVSIAEAFKGLSARVPGTDIAYFVVAVLIQRETGGNLTELFGNIASLVRERLRLFGQIRVLSAEGRFSAWILGLLPFGVMAFLQIGNPAFLQVMWDDPVGRTMVGGMLLFMGFGVLWMRKVIRIRV
jgi:tight adherence protein B